MGNHFATHLNCIIARNGWICCEDLAFRIHFLDPTLWKTSLPCRSPQLDWNIYVESAQQFHRNVAMVSVNFAIFSHPLDTAEGKFASRESLDFSSKLIWTSCKKDSSAISNSWIFCQSPKSRHIPLNLLIFESQPFPFNYNPQLIIIFPR